MTIYLTPSFRSRYKKLIRNNPQLEIKIKEKINIFQENPAHLSLKLHKLKGGLHSNWSFSIDRDLRIILTYIDGGILFVDIGRHDEVY